MKHIREIKVAVLAVICVFLLYFGMSFLKGANIFSSSHTYQGKFVQVGGLTLQSPVYVRGYKVGLVSAIEYDFSKDTAFVVEVSVDKKVMLPDGSKMMLVADGLLGGKAIELVIPVGDMDQNDYYTSKDVLPTDVEPGFMENMQMGLLAHMDSVLIEVDGLVDSVKQQLEGNHIQRTLVHVDQITSDLTVSAQDIRQITHQRVPMLMDSAQVTITYANAVLSDLQEADLKNTIGKLDSTVDQVNRVLTSTDGTVGALLNDKTLYTHIDSAIVSVDSLVTDLKANPKRYVHFSLFGGKDKKKK